MLIDKRTKLPLRFTQKKTNFESRIGPSVFLSKNAHTELRNAVTAFNSRYDYF